MALPADVQTVTITGTYLDTQGVPCSGTISFSPPCRITSATGGVILAGSITVELDENGQFSVDLPCTDQDGINPTCFTYEVSERLSCTNCPRFYSIALPCGEDSWDLADLAPVDSSPGVIVIRGPAGASVEGEDPITVTGSGAEADPYVVGLQLSEDAGNTLTVGSDGGLYATGGEGGRTFLEAGDQVEITGTGTQSDPYVINSVDTITAVTGGDGILVGTQVSGPGQIRYTVAADISTDPGNTLILGSDTGLYVAAGEVTAITSGANVTITGAGTAADPYVIASTGPLTSITAGTNVTITGTGTAADPYVINSASEQADTAIEAGDGITVTGTGTGADPYIVAADLSGDTGNVLQLGTDGGLFVAPAATSLTAGANVTITGTGTAGDPYVIAATDTVTSISAGANVTITGAGTAASPYVISATDTNTVTTVTAGDGIDVTGSPAAGYTVAADLSADTGNALQLGTDGGLFVAPAEATSISAGANVTVTGTGTAADPYVIASTDTDTVTTVTAGTGLTVTGSPTDGYTVAADLSTDTPNLLTVGTDGGLLAVPTAVDAGANVTVTGTGTAADPYVISTTGTLTNITAGANVTVTGTGTAADPYVIASTDTDTVTTMTGDNGVTVTGSPTAGYLVEADLSADEPNLLQLGTDGGLLVPGVYGYGNSNTITLGTATAPVTPTITGSTDGDFTISGTNVVLTRPGMYWISAQFRFNISITDFTTPTANVAVSIGVGAGGTRTINHATSRGSSVYGITHTRMEDCPAGQIVYFEAARSSVNWTGTPTVGPVWWQIFRVGPSLLYS